jgi:2Fe-2S ferredoxin
MPIINFIDPTGKKHTVEAESGQTVMEVAIRNMVPGIVAECTGACSCATCHVYVDEEWQAITGEAGEMEQDMLDFAIDPRDSSRLSCQIRITDAMDGLTVRVPERQH